MKMENEIFKKSAGYYDLLYSDKDYEKEVSFVENLFGRDTSKKILELGCGTGNYTKLLLKRGYDVTGVDLSDEMLNIARKRMDGKFLKGDIRDFTINKKFDVCLITFNVIGYITKTSEIIKTFKNIKNHLNEGGILIFDFWNGLGVINDPPTQRMKEVENENMKILRFTTPNLRSAEHLCDINFKFLEIDKKNNTFSELYERHSLRFFFPLEIKYLLENSGFEVLKMCPFLESEGEVNEKVWNLCIVAKVKMETN